MFKKSTTNRQLDFFGSFDLNLDEARREVLNDPKEWHNQFFEHITNRIDEAPYAVLYHETMGRPNAPIRLMVSMLILKEGFGWSDKELFREVSFNLIIMKALGLGNLNDKAPAQSTYYLFKNLLFKDQVTHGRDLIGVTFNQLGKAKADIFGVFGDKVRMDTKLIGSNVANCSRLQLIIACLQTFWTSLSEEQQNRLKKDNRQRLNELCLKKPNQIVYPMSEAEKSKMILQLGKLLLILKRIYDDSDSDKYDLITRLLDEQFEIHNKKAKLKKPSEISADSLQSPHDPDAAYRNKNGQKVRGYTVNVTETCHPTAPNLITDIQVEKATAHETVFVQSAIENTEQVAGEVKEISLDGAYNDQSNRQYAQNNDIELYFTGIQGPKGQYEFIPTPSGLKVHLKQTGQILDAIEYKKSHYKIKLPSGNWRYFKPEQIESYQRRKIAENLPESIRHRRNNVEATLFQLCYFTRNNKTRYRGQIKNSMWAYCRGIWINLIRICNYWKKITTPPKIPVICV